MSNVRIMYVLYPFMIHEYDRKVQILPSYDERTIPS